MKRKREGVRQEKRESEWAEAQRERGGGRERQRETE